MRVAAIALLLACGGAPVKQAPDAPDEDAVPRGAALDAEAEPEPTTTTTTSTTTSLSTSTTVAVTAEGICRRIAELKAQGCRFLERYEVSTKVCVADYERGLSERPGTEKIGRCFLEQPDCEAVVRCIDASLPSKPSG